MCHLCRARRLSLTPPVQVTDHSTMFAEMGMEGVDSTLGIAGQRTSGAAVRHGLSDLAAPHCPPLPPVAEC